MKYNYSQKYLRNWYGKEIKVEEERQTSFFIVGLALMTIVFIIFVKAV